MQESDEVDYADLIADDKDQEKILATHSQRRSRIIQNPPQISAAPPKVCF